VPLGRRHRGYLERLPDAVHVPLVLSHGPQDKGRNQPAQALWVSPREAL
jgi:hypothetical protein